MKTPLIILIALAFVSHLSAQTVAEAYPELLGTMPEHYVYDERTEFSPLSKPNADEWVKGLRLMDPISEEQRCIVVYRRGKEIAFVRLHHAQKPLGTSEVPDQLYKIGPDYLELIQPLSITDQRLWTTEIGAARWVWHYSQDGRVISKDVYRSAGGTSWTLIRPRALEEAH